jgi:RNA polymerase sigma factor (TIGR02999 family)
MNEVTRILSALDQGDPSAANRLLPLVYDELRRLAEQKLSQERPGQTLQATALVHEAYLRLVGSDPEKPWHNRGHFCAAAAEAMRRILIENARRKAAGKHGGGKQRVPLDQVQPLTEEPSEQLLALDEALTELQQHEAQAAQLVKLRYFAGLTHQQAAQLLGVTRRAADRLWSLARAWLHQRLQEM